MKKENTPENGRHGVMKVAPDQAKMSGSLRAIFDIWAVRPPFSIESARTCFSHFPPFAGSTVCDNAELLPRMEGLCDKLTQPH